MDHTREIEAKFNADGISVSQVMTFASGKKGGALKEYLVVGGLDQYWAQGESTVRLRVDDRDNSCTLTVKQRKSTKQIFDRHEVDLPIQPSVTPASVVRFLELSGWKLEFQIEKTSHIWRFKYADHEVLLALYDVYSGKTRRRFMEVEVEKESACSPNHAMTVLKNWIASLTTEFSFAKPLNQSLYDLYGPGSK